jgi:hypothetical protein
MLKVQRVCRNPPSSVDGLRNQAFTLIDNWVARPGLMTAKVNTDDHPLRDERNHEKVQNDNSAKSYSHDSDGSHSKEDTPVPCLWLL